MKVGAGLQRAFFKNDHIKPGLGQDLRGHRGALPGLADGDDRAVVRDLGEAVAMAERDAAAIERLCAETGEREPVIVPELDGDVRSADVGLLYDPRRRGEAELCVRWKRSLTALAPHMRVRRNYPYAGKADGLTSHLRRHFTQQHYIGIELEINQGITLAGGGPWKQLRQDVIGSLGAACSALTHADIGDS